ncbi:MAG: ORF6N domain-containing protein [Pseudomonadota bacterium]
MGKDVTDPLAEIAGRILVVRGQRVLLDADLAQLYGVSTKAFNQAVRRNRVRFPGDFLIDLTNQEVASLRSQFVTLKTGRGEHRKYRQLAFTEHGAIMAATILNSPRAEQMSVYVVRAFVKLRESLAAHTVLARELATLKSRVDTLDDDTRSQFDQVYEAILGLMSPAAKKQ